MATPSQIVHDTLESHFGREELYDKARRDINPYVINRIDNRATSGDFLGGKWANKFYSTNPLPASYFGKTSYNANNGSVTVDPQNLGRMLLSKSELFWRTTQNGATAFYKEGYLGFKTKAKGGTRPTHVDLTLSGTMLRGLDAKANRTTTGIEIIAGIFNRARAYAGEVNEKREFLALNDRELEAIKRMIQQ